MVWIFETRPETSVVPNGELWAGMVGIMLLASAIKRGGGFPSDRRDSGMGTIEDGLRERI